MCLGLSRLANLWVQAGGPRKFGWLMANIAKRESSGDPTAKNLTYPDHSIGLWQINQLAHKGRYGDDKALEDPLTNAKAAVGVWKASGKSFSPWSTYNAATDSKYIGAHAQELSAQKAGSLTAPVAGVQTNPYGDQQNKMTKLLDIFSRMNQPQQQPMIGQTPQPQLMGGMQPQTSPYPQNPFQLYPNYGPTPQDFSRGMKLIKMLKPPKASPSHYTTPGVRTGNSTGPSSGGVKIHPNGRWSGTEGPAVDLFRQFGKPLGLQVTSSKRNNTNPYSGSRSDHDFGNKDAYAIDASNGSSPTPEMDEYAYKLMHALGFKDYKKGTPINASQGVTTIKGLRFQVIYRGNGEAFGGNHLSHVHIGIKRVA